MTTTKQIHSPLPKPKFIFFLCAIISSIIPIYIACAESPGRGEKRIKLDPFGKPLQDQGRPYSISPWSCVLDSQTGLIWEVKSANSGLQAAHHTYSWLENNDSQGTHGAQQSVLCTHSICNTRDYINAINEQKLCGINSWRLPNRWELASLIDYHRSEGKTSIDTAWFPNTVHEFYWSSTTDIQDPGSAWGIGFRFGFDYAYPKADPGRVRLVSGPEFHADGPCAQDTQKPGNTQNTKRSQSTPQFPRTRNTRNKNQETRFIAEVQGTVFDKHSGLRWRRCSLGQQWDGKQCQGSSQAMPLSAARQQLVALADARGSWTLPEVNELHTLTQSPCTSAAINGQLFPGTPGAAYWSATPFASDHHRQWVINFKYGENDTLIATENAFVRPVLRIHAPATR